MEKKPEERKCPHCKKVIEPEPMTEESIQQLVDIIRAAERAGAATGISASEALGATMRTAMELSREGEAIDLRAITGRIQ